MDKLKEVTAFVEKHTDEQCGLEVADVHIHETPWESIQVIVTAKKSLRERKDRVDKGISFKRHEGMKSEWRRQAYDLIDEIGGDPGAGLGGLRIKFELYTVSNSYFEIREVE